MTYRDPPPCSAPPEAYGRRRNWRVLAIEELGNFRPVVLVARGLCGLLPRYVGGRVRARVLALAGILMGPGCLVWGTPDLHGRGRILSRLTLGKEVHVNVGCFFDLNDRVTIGDFVGLGQEVMVLTASHKLGDTHRRSGLVTTAPVTIGAGAWIGARAVILPGVTIGEGAVVSAGAVVNADVPANSLVAGAPAKVIVRRLPGS